MGRFVQARGRPRAHRWPPCAGLRQHRQLARARPRHRLPAELHRTDQLVAHRRVADTARDSDPRTNVPSHVPPGSRRPRSGARPARVDLPDRTCDRTWHGAAIGRRRDPARRPCRSDASCTSGAGQGRHLGSRLDRRPTPSRPALVAGRRRVCVAARDSTRASPRNVSRLLVVVPRRQPQPLATLVLVGRLRQSRARTAFSRPPRRVVR